REPAGRRAGDPAVRRALAQQAGGVRQAGCARHAVVVGHGLPEGGARERDMILLGGQGERELVASVGARLLVAEALRRDEEADLPEHLAALEPEAVVCTGGNEVLLRVRAQRDAADEVGNGAVLAVSLALGGDADGGLLRNALDEGEADADGTATLDGAFEVALVDV